MELNGTLGWLIGRGVALLIGVVILLAIYRIGISAIHRIVPGGHQRASEPPPVRVELGRGGRQADHHDRGSSPQAPARRRAGRARDRGAGRLRALGGPRRHHPAHRGYRVRHEGRRARLRDGVPDPRRGSVLQGRLPRRQRPPRIEGVVEEIGLRRTLLRDGMGSSQPSPTGSIRLPCNLTRLFSVAVVDLHVLHAGRARRGPCHGHPGRKRDARGSRLAGSIRDRFRDRLSGHRHRHGRGDDPLAAASPGGRSDQPSPASYAVALRAALVAGSIGTGRWDTPMPIATRSAGS